MQAERGAAAGAVRAEVEHQASGQETQAAWIQEAQGGRTMRVKLVGTLLVVLIASLAVTASSACAAADILAFEVGSTESRVGMHPDLETNVTIAEAGNPEAARNIIVNL